jgi:hypothetical protein
MLGVIRGADNHVAEMQTWASDKKNNSVSIISPNINSSSSAPAFDAAYFVSTTHIFFLPFNITTIPAPFMVIFIFQFYT